MKAILALATLALVTLVMEEKGRQVAGEAKDMAKPWPKHGMRPRRRENVLNSSLWPQSS